MFKIIGIGNQLMCDDGIALVVLNELREEIKQLGNIELISGENDYMYCLDNINKGDIVIIIDSSLLGDLPGTVRVRTLSQLKEKKVYSSKHQVNLPELINKHHEDVKTYTIGIEVYQIDFHYGLSNVLKEKLTDICIEVFQSIKKIIKENKYA